MKLNQRSLPPAASSFLPQLPLPPLVLETLLPRDLYVVFSVILFQIFLSVDECDFEYSVGGNLYCQWTQDNADNFDWTRANGQTASVSTGPTTDHTLQTNQGNILLTSTRVSLDRKKKVWNNYASKSKGVFKIKRYSEQTVEK